MVFALIPLFSICKPWVCGRVELPDWFVVVTFAFWDLYSTLSASLLGGAESAGAVNVDSVVGMFSVFVFHYVTSIYRNEWGGFTKIVVVKVFSYINKGKPEFVDSEPRSGDEACVEALQGEPG